MVETNPGCNCQHGNAGSTTDLQYSCIFMEISSKFSHRILREIVHLLLREMSSRIAADPASTFDRVGRATTHKLPIGSFHRRKFRLLDLVYIEVVDTDNCLQ